jgi:DNA-binding sugar fermentation-stimulating protein
MVRASYKQAVIWIAKNDNSNSATRLSWEALTKKTTIILIAEIFQQPVVKVAVDVVKYTIQLEHMKVVNEVSFQKHAQSKVLESLPE